MQEGRGNVVSEEIVGLQSELTNGNRGCNQSQPLFHWKGIAT